MLLRLALAVGLAVGATASGSAQHVPLQPSADARPALSAPMFMAEDSTCATACQSSHDHCRVATKGSSKCDADRQRCLQACLGSRRR